MSGYTPPSWMRHITPWWLLRWLDERLDTCWTGMAMWKMGYEWEWWPSRSCFDPYDYCGKFLRESEIRRLLDETRVPAPEQVKE